MFIAEDSGGRAIGQIRFDLTPGGAEADVTVDPAHRGRGLGVAVIRSGVAALFARTSVTVVRARVKQWNAASVKAFTRAGFETVERQDEPDVVTLIARAGGER